MIIVFIGPSCSGKDLFYSKTLEKYNFNGVVLLTTRPMRSGEIEGMEYYFIDDNAMIELEKEGRIIEKRDYQTKTGIWSYATKKGTIDLNENNIVINTWDAFEKYIEYFGEDSVYPFYFDLDPNIRFERAYRRESKQEKKNYLEMCRRFIDDSEYFTEDWLLKYNPIIIDNNGSIEETEKQIDNNIQKIFKKTREH